MSQRKLSRRELLKLAAAATGAAALSTVPNKWVTPVVEIGALPAHAQASQRGAISGTVTVNFGATNPNKINSPNNLIVVTVATVSPSPTIAAGVLAVPIINPGTEVFPYLISNLVPGNNYAVHCTTGCGNPPDATGIVVTAGATTANVNFLVNCQV
jgi:uncharacterized membrane protein